MSTPALRSLLLWVGLASVTPSGGCAPPRSAIRTGDLLFLDLDCGPTCDAIEGVTTGVRGARLSHVGIADVAEDGAVHVVEAYEGVARVALGDFLARTGGRYVQVRLRFPLRDLAVRATRAALRRLGLAYDPLFRVGDDRYYCAELVYEAFREANGGTPLFPLAPMSFGDTDAPDDPWWPIWRRYFAALGEEVPQGEPGLNPGALSRSEHVEVLHFDP